MAIPSDINSREWGKFRESPSVAGQPVIRVVSDGVGYTPVQADAQSANATGGLDVWTPASGKKFVLTDLIISVDTAMAVTIKDGATTIGVIYLAANGGLVANLNTPLISAAANNKLNVVASVAGNISVTALGCEV